MLKSKDPALVDIERLLKSMRPLNPNMLRRYLKDIYRELSSDSQGGTFIQLLSFYEYSRVPLFIAEKVYNLLSGGSGILSLQKLEQGVVQILNANYQAALKMTFDFCDFDNDGRILQNDVKLILIYFIKFCNSFKSEAEIYEEKNFEQEILTLLHFYFCGKEIIDYNQYKNSIESKISDLFYILLVIIHKCLPFDEENINYYFDDKRLKEVESADTYNLSHHSQCSNQTQAYSSSDYKSISEVSKLRSEFSDTTGTNSNNFDVVACSQIAKSKFFAQNENEPNLGIGKINQTLIQEKLLPPSTSKINMIVDDNIFEYANFFLIEKIQENVENLFEKLSISHNLDKHFDNEVSLESMRKDSSVNNSFDLQMKKPQINSQDHKNFLEASDSNSSYGEKISIFTTQSPLQNKSYLSPFPKFKFYEKFNKFHYENYLYKFDVKKQKMSKVYIVISNKEMYYFKNSTKTTLKGMHYLKDYITAGDKFIDQENFMVLENINYYCISLYINNKNREFFVKRSEDFLIWTEVFKRVLKIRSLSENYDIMSLIYEGKTESIFKAQSLKNNEIVSVKLYPKKEIFKNIYQNEVGTNLDSKLNNYDTFYKKLRMMITEREILQYSKHKNIIRLLDYFEDLENIYLVTEYLERGNLNKFLSTHREDLSMIDLIKIIYQICEGIEYLHSNGIIHHDIKPQNIVMDKKNLHFNVKIIDFNLSSISSDSERHTHSYGTFHFASPEVLLNNPHDKMTDIWSLGVTMYYVIYGTLVFPDEQAIVNTIKQDKITINYPYNFNINEQDNLMLQDLISSCLRKDPSKRLTIQQIMNHEIFMIVNNF
jgi:tRNA A-37 threonylcarbamoyl transferase component Bud32